ncbi:MAG TPA: M20/M25/M40 family metallo-hydrolase [Phycisphaerales bacterium]|nr:M20/M25/M40 family metallo-hydrolase [Phycisphaerales bacterium]
MPLDDLERRVCGVIERRGADMLRDLAAHVAIPTGANFKPGLDEYREAALARLRALGATVTLVAGDPRPEWLELPGATCGEEVIPPVAIARAKHVPDLPRVLIAGHLDTVHDPHGDFRELSIAPDGRTAVGPGAVDMKGGIVIALAALEALAECGVPCNWSFLLNSDEETGSFHSARALSEAAREHDVGLALEPAMPDGGLVVSRMGAGQFKVEAFGRSAHVGRDFAKGVSAVAALARVLLKLDGLARPSEGVIVNVGPLQGGSVTNAVPDHAACWGNVRFADEGSARQLGREVDLLATGQDGLPRIVVHRAFNRPAKPLITRVRTLADEARAVAQDLGQALPFGSTGGVCDGNILQEAGLPTIDTLGVRGGNLHTRDEFVEVASLVDRAALFAVLLKRLARNRRSAKV